jgi:hypothetical protein
MVASFPTTFGGTWDHDGEDCVGDLCLIVIVVFLLSANFILLDERCSSSVIIGICELRSNSDHLSQSLGVGPLDIVSQCGFAHQSLYEIINCMYIVHVFARFFDVDPSGDVIA